MIVGSSSYLSCACDSLISIPGLVPPEGVAVVEKKKRISPLPVELRSTPLFVRLVCAEHGGGIDTNDS